jgi:hypothetical protein
LPRRYASRLRELTSHSTRLISSPTTHIWQVRQARDRLPRPPLTPVSLDVTRGRYAKRVIAYRGLGHASSRSTTAMVPLPRMSVYETQSKLEEHDGTCSADRIHEG